MIDLAADAAQEAFISAFRALNGDRGRGLSRAWLLRTVTNACYDEIAAANAGHPSRSNR